MEPLDRQKIEATIKDILNSEFGCDVREDSDMDANFNELGLDSLDRVEFVMSLEKEFDVDVPEKDADSVRTPRQAVTMIALKLGVTP